MSTVETPVGTTTPTPEATPAPTDWSAGLPDELKGYVQTKGFKDPASVVDSYRNLEKLVGVKDKLVQVPDNLGDEKAMEAVWNKLGRPEKPEGYGFKASEGAEKFVQWAGETFHKLGLNSNQAKALMEGYDKFAADESTAMEGLTKANNEKMINELKTKWGSAYDQNLKVANAAAQQFGIDKETVNKLESSMGFAKTMDLLQTIGSKIGEADYVSGDTKGGFGKVLTPNQASEKLSALMQDPDWSKKYLDGGVQQRQEMENLLKMQSGTYGQ
jgi:hypothetical protein